MTATSQDPADRTPPAWILTGPTAVGKTDLALRLAELEDLEILSMDSMAVYRRMDIGTAKPAPDERERVPHHLLDLVDPDADFDTNRWCTAAEAAVADIRSRGRRPLFVGGTPLYLMAFFKGMVQGPSAVPEIRDRLTAREQSDPGCLHRELAAVDPGAAARIHAHDLKRLVRALEYHEVTGERISVRRDHFDAPDWRVPCRIVAVRRQREQLHERVKRRTITMLEAGLVEEVRAIRDDCGFSKTSATAIGYAECLRHLDGGYKDLEELRNMIRRSTHGLIRRQTTWLRRIREVQWIDPQTTADSLATILDQVAT
jgi:tRNA dimethylallyltransferase